jgi:citrate lyase subunit beta / citryl-CoA lyase
MKLRSLLFVPGDRPDQMQKALSSGTDALILDLEDSVAASNKDKARGDVAAFLRRAERPTPILVRINPITSGYLDADLGALEEARPDGLVLPKAEGAESLLTLLSRMQARGMSPLRMLPIATETAAAIFRLGEYAKVSEHLLGLTWGAEDLSAAVGAATARTADGRYTAPYDMARSLALFAAHAAQVAAIETVYPAFRDLDGLTRYAACGARDGFSGMMAIHPSQVSIINTAFTPSPEAVAQARRVVEAFAKHPGAGVLSLDGAMVDAPHLKQAQRVLAQVGTGGATT